MQAGETVGLAADGWSVDVFTQKDMVRGRSGDTGMRVEKTEEKVEYVVLTLPILEAQRLLNLLTNSQAIWEQSSDPELLRILYNELDPLLRT